MMREKITKSLQGRILLISMIGLVACVLSVYMVSSITIQSIEQQRLENSLMANMDNEMEHLEFCYFTMVRMMQQMGEDGSIGSMLEDYLYSENNFEKYQRRRELEEEIVSIGFINNYVNLAIYIDSDTKEELFDSVAFDDKDFDAGCVMQIGENQFQALRKSKRRYNDSIVVSLLEERQVFDGRTLDIYIEMKSNIQEYAPRGGRFLSLHAAGRRRKGAVFQQRPVRRRPGPGACAGWGRDLLGKLGGLLSGGKAVRYGVRLCERGAPGRVPQGDDRMV